MKSILKQMLLEFFIILAGITICAAVFCTLFSPDATLGVAFLWQTIALAFLTTLPQLLFWSKKEPPKKRLIVRQVLHIVLIVGILVFFAYTWGWIDPGSLLQPIVFLLLVLAVYAGVSLLSYHQEKNLAKLLNAKLQEYKDKE